MSNLDNQSGALEYFFILFVIGLSLSSHKYNKIVAILVSAGYIYFAFTRGYRVQLLEMILILTFITIIKRLTVGWVVVMAIFGFIALQIHGSMKHGMGDLAAAASVFLGDEIRTNQTEVFYTSNNVVNALHSGTIGWDNRAESFLTALVASVVPTAFLPNSWHPSLYTGELTGLPAGGGVCGLPFAILAFLSRHLDVWVFDRSDIL